jgi:hypothetical protein
MLLVRTSSVVTRTIADNKCLLLLHAISSSITEPLVCNHHEESSCMTILLDPYGVVNMGARHAKEWIGNQNHTPELMKKQA